MNWITSGVAMLIAAVLSVAVGAQSGGAMSKGDKTDKMEMMDASYTGCIEAGSAAGTFALTHLAGGDQMGKDTIKKDAIAKDSMSDDQLVELVTFLRQQFAPEKPVWTGVRAAVSQARLRISR